jgi:hypothetical protein
MPLKQLIPFKQIDDATHLTVAQLLSFMHNERVLVLQPNYEPYHKLLLHQVEVADAALIDVLIFKDETDFLAQLSLFPQGCYSDIVGFNFIHQFLHIPHVFHSLSAFLAPEGRLHLTWPAPFVFAHASTYSEEEIALEVCNNAMTGFGLARYAKTFYLERCQPLKSLHVHTNHWLLCFDSVDSVASWHTQSAQWFFQEANTKVTNQQRFFKALYEAYVSGDYLAEIAITVAHFQKKS